MEDRDGSNPQKELHLEVEAFARVDWQGEPINSGTMRYYVNDIIVDTSDLTKNTFNVDVNIPKNIYVEGTDKVYPLSYDIYVYDLPDSYTYARHIESNDVLPILILDTDSQKVKTEYAYAYVQFTHVAFKGKDGSTYYPFQRDDARLILSYKSKVTVGNQELQIPPSASTGTWIRMTKEELENNEQ